MKINSTNSWQIPTFSFNFVFMISELIFNGMRTLVSVNWLCLSTCSFRSSQQHRREASWTCSSRWYQPASLAYSLTRSGLKWKRTVQSNSSSGCRETSAANTSHFIHSMTSPSPRASPSSPAEGKSRFQIVSAL